MKRPTDPVERIVYDAVMAKPGPKPDPAIAARNAQICSEYLDGASLAELAGDFGVSVRLVRKVLKARGIDTRPVGVTRPGPRPTTSEPRPRLTGPEREASAERRRAYLSTYHARRKLDPEKQAMKRAADIAHKTRKRLRQFLSQSARLTDRTDD